MTTEQAKKLREPFKPEQIGKLPKAGIMLDYVGHAATTDRLLQVDPSWSWEPMAFGPNGEPLMVNGGMWIRLTVCGVTRPGFGDGKNPKEIIGDAIRNAAMRFGVALDLWAKEDLTPEPEASTAAASTQRKPSASAAVSSGVKNPGDIVVHLPAAVKGKRLADLSDAQVRWYAETLVPESPEDEALKTAAITLLLS